MNAAIDISGVTLKTKRLIIRPWRESDLEDLYAYARVDGVGQMAGWAPHESIENSKFILDMFISKKKTFALELEGRVVGSLGIEAYDEEVFPELKDIPARELGYVLAKDCWGRGLMPEAVREVIRYLFEEVGLDAITCGYFLRNKQSARVQQKCGFKPLRQAKFKTHMGTVEDIMANVLYKKDWAEAQR